MGQAWAILRLPSRHTLSPHIAYAHAMYPRHGIITENTGHPYSIAWPDEWLSLDGSTEHYLHWELDTGGPVAQAFDDVAHDIRILHLPVNQADLEKLARSMVTDPSISEALTIVDGLVWPPHNGSSVAQERLRSQLRNRLIEIQEEGP